MPIYCLGEALPLLEAGASADPNSPRYAYVYGVALHDSGQGKHAIAVLERALTRFPRDPDLLSALSAYTLAAGDTGRAQAYSKRLQAISASAP